MKSKFYSSLLSIVFLLLALHQPVAANPGGTLDSIFTFNIAPNGDTVPDGWYYYTYDSAGNNILEWHTTKYDWSPDPIFIYLDSNVYDGNNRIVESIHMRWYGQWDYYSRWLVTYDSIGNRLTSITQDWIANRKEWENYGKAEWTYDNEGRNTAFAQFEWNKGYRRWDYNSRDVIAYNSDGDTASVTYQYGQLLQWKNASRITYTYDFEGNTIMNLNQQWITNLNIWKDYSRTDYAYDNPDQMRSAAQFQWSDSLQAWQNYEFFQFYYDSLNRLTRTFIQIPDTGMLWKNFYLTDYRYDSLTTGANEKEQYWNEDLGTWERAYERTDVYDSLRLLAFREVGQLNQGGKWNIMQQNYYNYNEHRDIVQFVGNFWYDSTYGRWMQRGGSYYYYTYKSVGIEPVEASSFRVYPNPSNGSFFIQLENTSESAQLKIYDLLGHLVKEEQLSFAGADQSQPIQVSGLLSGVYLLQVNQRNKSQTRKIVLK